METLLEKVTNINFGDLLQQLLNYFDDYLMNFTKHNNCTELHRLETNFIHFILQK